MTKPEKRSDIRRLTAGLPEEYIKSSDAAIFERLTALPEFASAQRVFAYCSIGREVDTRALIAHCLRTGKPVALPKTGAGGKMSFFLVSAPLEELTAGVFGIPEPDGSSPPVFPAPGDIIVVPALCFDESGFRLGHGGGYYDRFLSGVSCKAVGLCREELLQTAVPKEAHDIAVDILLTENKTARPARGPAK